MVQVPQRPARKGALASPWRLLLPVLVPLMPRFSAALGSERAIHHYRQLGGESRNAQTVTAAAAYRQGEPLCTFLNLFFNCCNIKKLVSTDGVELPETAKVKLSTDENQEADSSISLDKLTLGPRQALLLQFPYTA